MNNKREQSLVKAVKEGSVDISFDECTDEDSFSLDETSNNNVTLSESENEQTFDLNDENIDKEFEDFLNDDTSLSDNLSKENLKFKSKKIKKLENLDLSFDNFETIRRMAIEKYGFVNKKFRRRAWPILILHRFKHKGSLNDLIESSLSKFNNISTKTEVLFSKMQKY